MRRTIRQVIALVAFACLLGLGKAADAQIIQQKEVAVPPPAPVQPVQPGAANEPVLVVPTGQATQNAMRRLSFLQGTALRLNGGATAGRVNDFILNAQGGIDYVVVSNNGQNMLLPYTAANFDWSQRQIGLNMDQARFQQIPTFTQNDWATVFAPQSPYVGRLNTFFGTGATTTQSGVNVLGNPLGPVATPGTTPGTSTQTPLGPGAIPSGPGLNPAGPGARPLGPGTVPTGPGRPGATAPAPTAPAPTTPAPTTPAPTMPAPAPAPTPSPR